MTQMPDIPDDVDVLVTYIKYLDETEAMVQEGTISPSALSERLKMCNLLRQGMQRKAADSARGPQRAA
ncbi:MAG: hypothetical protein FWE64_01750 [Alphaproteobacteria bacterium]|nr:hypothetical protein [Alphaproteobacteria bacterium]